MVMVLILIMVWLMVGYGVGAGWHFAEELAQVWKRTACAAATVERKKSTNRGAPAPGTDAGKVQTRRKFAGSDWLVSTMIRRGAGSLYAHISGNHVRAVFGVLHAGGKARSGRDLAIVSVTRRRK